MPDELQISRRPELERPVLIAAFRGWNDGGQGASLAAGYLAKLWEAKRFAEIDPENFFDFQATRPHVSLEEGHDAKDRLAGDGLLPRASAGARSRRRAAARHRAEPPLAHLHRPDRRASSRSSASSSSSRSARCSPTSRTRGPAPSRAARPTRSSFSVLASPPPGTRARLGSSAFSTTGAAGPGSPRPACGLRSRTTSR